MIRVNGWWLKPVDLTTILSDYAWANQPAKHSFEPLPLNAIILV